MAFFEGISFVGVIAFLVATSVVSPILPTVANPVLSVTTSVPNAAAKSLGCPMMANTLPASHASVTLLSSPVDPFQQSSIVSSQVGNAMASAVNSHIQQNVANAIAHLTASQSMMAANPLAMAKNPFSHFSSMPAALSIPGMTTTTNSPGRTIVETRYEIVDDKKNTARKSTSKPVSSTRSSGSRFVITHDDGTPIGKLY